MPYELLASIDLYWGFAVVGVVYMYLCNCTKHHDCCVDFLLCMLLHHSLHLPYIAP